MKKLYILFIITTCTLFATAQVDWILNNTNTSNNLNDAWFINAQQGWVVGDNGIILHTPDAGFHWTEQTSGINTNLNSVCFVNSLQGCAVGINGKILTTVDGGATWTQQTSNTTYELKAVFFISPLKGWAVGSSGTILHTSDGGATWIIQTYSSPQNLKNVKFINDTIGYAVGAFGQVLFTQNAGTNWAIQTTNTVISIYDIFLTDTLHGWLCRQDGKTMVTNNGGTTWTQQNTNNTKFLTSIFFLDTLCGWTTGQDGTTLYTSNGGSNWQNITTSTGNINTIQSIFFANSGAGWMVGSAGTALKAYEIQNICFVTFDPALNRNKIVWEPLQEMGISFYKILKYQAGGFVPFDTVYHNELSLAVDYVSDPHTHDFYYSISSVDSFGNENPRCPHHRTMFLQVSQGSPVTTINLNWNAYKDSSYSIIPSYYIIFKGTSPDLMDSIDYVPAMTGQEYYAWSDYDITTPYYYQVGIRMPFSCTATGDAKDMSGPFSQSLSNIEDNGIIDNNKTLIATDNSNLLHIYPIPSHEKIRVSINTKMESEYIIYNSIGKVVSMGLIDQKINIDISKYPQGLYLMKVLSGKNSTVKSFIKY
ncbi:MAG: hypothetical protein A2275_16155 [Bacteroidetes bacterium RIFOXYA12_FULL_35_11]|nr:MAG: hypothetical protein A2X01_05325 [Bacteroidetes bacterium GWF2_35_48]OFY75908.1 MAG: hypothetical protein A2275_16155 [Bacteroidetes bacterium RIFOXYA12_FULL_35_11]OFY95735.1 MAG: hypothetical protein A2491_08720 [Bacteroidetes bacterium RIFOXYC12_FULL_35_7]HBX52175.1 hypothetical protein [Bacteroidales bacterium]